MKTEVKELLENPDLFNNIDNEFNKEIVGEVETRKTIFIVSNLRNVINKKPTSSNLLANSKSGSGKDCVSEAVFKILPKEERVEKDRITPKTLSYLNNKSKNPKATWKKKVLRLQDTPNKVLNDDSFKVFSSSEYLNQTLIVNQKPIEFKTDCKPPIIISSAEANPKQEQLRRFPIIKCDESVNQTKAIIERKIEYEKKGISTQYNPIITEALSELKEVKVRIPFVEMLKPIFESEDLHLIARTTFDRFLDYIRSSTALHQYQREQEDGYYLATKEDYEIGRIALQKTTSNTLMIPITRLQEEVINKLKSIENKFYSVNELEKNFTCSDRWLRKQLDKLTENGFFEKGERESEKDTNKKIITYKLKGISNMKIPTWNELENLNS